MSRLNYEHFQGASISFRFTCFKQDKEEKGEDDEPLPTVIPKWKAGKTQAITIQTEEEELEELQQLPTDNMISESQEEPKSEGETLLILNTCTQNGIFRCKIIFRSHMVF